MKFIVDAQLPAGLCVWLQNQGHEALYSPDILGGGEGDHAIAQYAADNKLVVVTKDRDFLTLHACYGHELMWLRCGNMLNERLYQWFEQRWPDASVSLQSGERLVVVT